MEGVHLFAGMAVGGRFSRSSLILINVPEYVRSA